MNTHVKNHEFKGHTQKLTIIMIVILVLIKMEPNQYTDIIFQIAFRE